MEINITDFVRNADASEFSASQVELGKDAGKITWNNAKQEASRSPLIGEDALDEFRAWIDGFGAWSQDEINTWSLAECNALLIQFISGDLRELESLCFSDKDEFGIAWDKAEQLSKAGTIGGRIYKTDDSRVYFYMGD